MIYFTSTFTNTFFSLLLCQSVDWWRSSLYLTLKWFTKPHNAALYTTDVDPPPRSDCQGWRGSEVTPSHLGLPTAACSSTLDSWKVELWLQTTSPHCTVSHLMVFFQEPHIIQASFSSSPKVKMWFCLFLYHVKSNPLKLCWISVHKSYSSLQ